jgi:fatty acid desaturase
MNTTKQQAIIISRLICIALVAISTGLYFWNVQGPFEITVEILIRTYILFLCGVMGHEGSHGNLGKLKAANEWWSRFVFIPIAVPNAPFRITHRYHHAFTNVEGKDPDMLLKIDSIWQFPGRALAMPHHWVIWLKENGLFTKKVIAEYVFSYLFYILFYGALIYLLGAERVLYSLIPAQILNSFLLWYPFAIKNP